MNETAIKAHVIQHLRAESAVYHDSVLASEFVLGSTGRRVDLAIWNGQFIGIEVKSKFDSLVRLSAQMHTYVRCFDRVILVVDTKHVPKAAEIIRDGVELWSVDEEGQVTRVASPIRCCQKDSEALAELCTMAQLRRLTLIPAKSRVSRRNLVSLAAHLPSQLLANVVIAAFRTSFSESSDLFWRSVGSERVAPSHIHTLSRFAGLRKKQVARQEAEVVFWDRWALKATELFAS